MSNSLRLEYGPNCSYARIEEILKEIESIKKLHPEAEKFSIVPYDEYGSCSARIEFYRPPTLEEITKEKEDEAARKLWRRKEYERLKKEFGE